MKNKIIFVSASKDVHKYLKAVKYYTKLLLAANSIIIENSN